MVEGNIWRVALCWLWLGSGWWRRWRSSGGSARRTVNDLVMNWAPNLRPFTAEVGLKE